MFPQIKIDFYDNDLFAIKNIENNETTISFIDFQYSNLNSTGSSNSSSSYPMTISPNIYNKTYKLEPLIFNSYINYNNLPQEIGLEIQKKFIKKIAELGEQNRKNMPKQIDIDVEKITKDISRTIISKIVSAGNYIAVEGRIGPAQWLISNQGTYNYICKYLSDVPSLFENGVTKIGNMTYSVNNLVEDDIILMGRKNNINQPGIHCLIQSSNDKYINFYEEYSPYNKRLLMNFSIIDIGFHPYTQYFKINTRSLAYNRNKKLQRIKQLYGE